MALQLATRERLLGESDCQLASRVMRWGEGTVPADRSKYLEPHFANIPLRNTPRSALASLQEPQPEGSFHEPRRLPSQQASRLRVGSARTTTKCLQVGGTSVDAGAPYGVPFANGVNFAYLA